MPKQGGESTTYNRDIGFVMRISYDGSKRTEYVGLAYPSASLATTSERWSIYKLTYDATSGGVATRYYANDTDAFKFAWDSRTIYSYG